MRTTKTDQTAGMRRLIRVFIGPTCQKVRFSHVEAYMFNVNAEINLIVQKLSSGSVSGGGCCLEVKCILKQHFGISKTSNYWEVTVVERLLFVEGPFY